MFLIGDRGALISTTILTLYYFTFYFSDKFLQKSVVTENSNPNARVKFFSPSH